MIDSLTQATRLVIVACGLALGLSLPDAAVAQRQEPAPQVLNEVGIDEQLGDQIPLDLRFRDENGAEVTLASLFPGDRPAVLSLNYSDCPMLCTLVLNGLIDGLEQLSWTPGRQFDVISVSIDPLETPQRARLTKQKYLRDYGRPETAAGWHFLTGTQENIKRLADAVGFRYKYVEKDKQYVARGGDHDLHPPGPHVALSVRRPVPGADAAAVVGRGRRRQGRLDDGQGAAVLLPLRCRSGPLWSGRTQSDEVGSGNDVYGGVAGADPVLAAPDGATWRTPIPRPRRRGRAIATGSGPLAGFALPLVGLLGARVVRCSSRSGPRPTRPWWTRSSTLSSSSP